MSEYCNTFKAKVINHILTSYAGSITRNEICVEEHDHDLTKNPWEIELTFRNEDDKLLKIEITIEDAPP